MRRLSMPVTLLVVMTQLMDTTGLYVPTQHYVVLKIPNDIMRLVNKRVTLNFPCYATSKYRFPKCVTPYVIVP